MGLYDASLGCVLVVFVDPWIRAHRAQRDDDRNVDQLDALGPRDCAGHPDMEVRMLIRASDHKS
jgi:hypothetical protein